MHRAADARLRIPIRDGLRSLNIAVAVAMVAGEASGDQHRLARTRAGQPEAVEEDLHLGVPVDQGERLAILQALELQGSSQLVHVDRGVEVLRGDLVEGLEVLLVPGVHDEKIEPSQFLRRSFGQIAGVSFVSEVTG